MARFDALEEVLIFAPLRGDAQMLANLCTSNQLDARLCSDETELLTRLGEVNPGALVITQEALTRGLVEGVGKHLENQPAWSELPIIVLVEEQAVRSTLPTVLSRHWENARRVFYQRPLARIELLSGVQSALFARGRQREVRDHIDLERELRHELNHRVKNILASVKSIFQMTLRNSESMADLGEGFNGRLDVLSTVHSALFEAGGKSFRLEPLASLVLSPYADQAGRVFRLEGPEITLNRDATTAFGLVLHELATNAIKYGAWSVEAGRIELTWTLDEGRFTLEWLESGGPAPMEAAKRGYGTRYIQRAFRGLFGQDPVLEFPASGMRLYVEGDPATIRDSEVESEFASLGTKKAIRDAF